MRWTEYLRDAKGGDDLVGAFIAEVRGDPDMPDVSNCDELEDYLLDRVRFGAGVKPVFIQAARAAWRQYQRVRRAQRDKLL